MDSAVLRCGLNFLIFLVFDIILVLVTRPQKRIIKAAFFSGIVLAFAAFCLEAYTNLIGLWGYVSDLTILGVPITVPPFYVAVGFGFPIFYEEFTARLNRRLKLPRFDMLFFVVYISVVSTGSVVGDLMIAKPEYAWGPPSWEWPPSYIFAVWTMLWLVNMGTYLFFKRRIR